jgi:hypothetical protein
MWRNAQGSGVRFSGTNIHTAIHQRRINADNFQRQMLNEFHRDTGFAGSCGAHQQHCKRSIH